jgi:putative chitinase
MIDVKDLQARLGVKVDGLAGVNTYTALFQKSGASLDRAQELGLAANAFFVNYGIMASKLRLAHFMAQLIHESGTFRYMEEIASGKAYEGRADLGNTQPGDGVRYKGRGPIQITGRANYRTFGRKIGIDIERHPEIAAIPSIGLHLALEYWENRKLNAPADQDDILAVTKAINGGTNGLEDRKNALAKMKVILS